MKAEGRKLNQMNTYREKNLVRWRVKRKSYLDRCEPLVSLVIMVEEKMVILFAKELSCGHDKGKSCVGFIVFMLHQ